MPGRVRVAALAHLRRETFDMFHLFKLKSPLGRAYNVDFADVRRTKKPKTIDPTQRLKNIILTCP